MKTKINKIEFEDYRIDRAVIDRVKIYSYGDITRFSKNARFINIPKDLVNRMGVTRYNESDFRVILVRKRKRKC